MSERVTSVPSCIPAADGSCSICGDEAVMSRVVAVAADAATAEVMVDGARTTIAIDLVDDVAVGDMLLVHMGFAISRLSQRELS